MRHARDAMRALLLIAPCWGLVAPSGGAHHCARQHSPARRGARLHVAAGEMGFQMQAGPMVSTGLIFASFAALQLKVAAYNAKGDELDGALRSLRDARVSELTSGDPESSGAVEAAERRVDDLRTELEDARAVTVFGVSARIRLPDRSQGSAPLRPAAPAPAEDEPSKLLNKKAVRVVALASTVVLLLPILLLLAADPMAPPSPQLAATLSAAADANPPSR